MKNKKRILAWAGIFAVAAAFIALVVLTFFGGSENAIVALLFCVIVIPPLLYAYQLILKVLQKNKDKDDFTE